MIQVRAPGLFTTVQDLGREGYGELGVSPSGAADPVALRIGNRLVGNPEGAAALEMTLLGGTFVFEDSGWFALSGADFEATLNGAAVPPWTAHEISGGQTLRVGPTRSGARCYLTVRGGIEVTLFLQSASTHVLSGLGGFEGRALRKGDALRIGGVGEGNYRPRGIRPEALARLAPRKLIRVTRGPQWEWFTPAGREVFLSTAYRLTEDCNRMGLRLEGPAVEALPHEPMVTEGVPLGAIQIPAGGQPILLFVEQQTTGGYPKIANAIAADLSSVGQLRPRDEVRFALVSPEEARAAIREQEALLRSEDLFFP